MQEKYERMTFERATREYHVMKAVYRHSMMEKEEESKRTAAKRFQNALLMEK